MIKTFKDLREFELKNFCLVLKYNKILTIIGGDVWIKKER